MCMFFLLFFSLTQNQCTKCLRLSWQREQKKNKQIKILGHKKIIMALNGKNNNKQSTETIIITILWQKNTNTHKHKIITKPICVCLILTRSFVLFCFTFFAVFDDQLSHFIACMCPVQFFFSFVWKKNNKKMSTPFGNFWSFVIDQKKIYYVFILSLEFCCWVVSSILISHLIYHLNSLLLWNCVYCICFVSCSTFESVFNQFNPFFHYFD